ncbi:hypothetical protein ACOCJ7_03130 [Knoellia sp. CPCC 206453]|uniref:hypothetical protein n=1 Tax=Knoellia pratensis TaxID=3404796 RepID=UPI00360F7C85
MTGETVKALDRKLATIVAGEYAPDDFIIADAKDADMAFGAAAAGPITGQVPPRLRSRQEYLAAMTALVREGMVDIMLTSASNAEQLVRDGVLDGSPVTLAARANDATDIWNQRGGHYPQQPSRPFRSADLQAVRELCDLVLYSVTFNNDRDLDLATLDAYARFRADARAAGLRHILEVFNPNAPIGLSERDVGAFVNDSIVRTLAGLTRSEGPLFLKVAFNGPTALEELVSYDPGLVVGVLGGSAGTTRDAFELLHQAERHGARVALFGRKIQQAESQGDLVRLMRPVLRGDLSPEQAVREYHQALHGLGLQARRSLDDDLVITEPVLEQD